MMNGYLTSEYHIMLEWKHREKQSLAAIEAELHRRNIQSCATTETDIEDKPVVQNRLLKRLTLNIKPQTS